MDCLFCDAAAIRYVRVLAAEEMIAQVDQVNRLHSLESFPVLMCSFQGIGEPSLLPQAILDVGAELLSRYRNLRLSIATLGSNLAAFRIWRDSSVPIANLQVSHSATTADQASQLIPRAPKLDRLLEELRLCALSRKFMTVKLNYLLIEGFNDSRADLDRLIGCFKESSVIVKISALNPTAASKKNQISPAHRERAQQFVEALQGEGIRAFLYGSFDDTTVSCGQLSALYVG